MRIGILAPISHPIPPPGYGPWELVVFNLVEELVSRGEDVTLFACEESATSARLVATAPEPLEGGSGDPRVIEQLHIARTMEVAAAGDLDVLHSHLHVHALGYGRLIPCPLISTLHGSAWRRAHHPALDAYRDLPFVSISNAERRFHPRLSYVATVYNGIRVEDFPFHSKKADYLLFAGRMAPEKGVDLAIGVARASGCPLVLVGKIEAKYQDYFDTWVRPHLDDEIFYAGEQTRAELAVWMANARALLMPLRWEEPFGLVVVESLACGTPVVAWNRGAMPELIVDGKHGFLVETVDQAAAAVTQLDEIEPEECRRRVEDRFSAAAMATGYLEAYRTVMER